MKRIKQRRLVSLQNNDSDPDSGVFYYKSEHYDIITTVFPSECFDDGITHYAVFQNAYIKTRSKKPERKTFLIFDIENINSSNFSLKGLKSFCDTHTGNKGIYKDILYGTFVKISDSGFLQFLLPFFEKFYTPVKPLRISTDWNEMDTFVKDCVAGRLGLQVSTNSDKAIPDPKNTK